MKIEKEFTSFTGQINVGRLAKFIKVSEKGINIDNDELIARLNTFQKIVFYGNPFVEKTELSKIIKKLIKQNPDIEFNVFCKPLIRPIGISAITKIEYYINIPLKDEGEDIEKRINLNVTKWFIDVKANFIFDIKTEDDIDESITIIQMLDIPKNLVYLSPNTPELLDLVIEKSIRYKYNIAPNFRKFLWDEYGKGDL